MENPQRWEKPRHPTGCKIHYMRGIQCRGKTQRQRPLVLFSLATRGSYNEEATTSLSLSLSLSISHALYKNFTITQQHLRAHTKVCPKSYLYIYDFSAYLHLCSSNRSEPIRAGSVMSRFSASYIRFHPEGHVSQHLDSPFGHTQKWTLD